MLDFYSLLEFRTHLYIMWRELIHRKLFWASKYSRCSRTRHTITQKVSSYWEGCSFNSPGSYCGNPYRRDRFTKGRKCTTGLKKTGIYNFICVILYNVFKCRTVQCNKLNYFNLCLSVHLDSLQCSFTSMFFSYKLMNIKNAHFA